MIVTEYDGVDDVVLAQCDRCGFEKVIPHPGSRPLNVRCHCRVQPRIPAPRRPEFQRGVPAMNQKQGPG